MVEQSCVFDMCVLFSPDVLCAAYASYAEDCAERDVHLKYLNHDGLEQCSKCARE